MLLHHKAPIISIYNSIVNLINKYSETASYSFDSYNGKYRTFYCGGVFQKKQIFLFCADIHDYMQLQPSKSS